MKEPTRLMLGRGPARELMNGSVLRVPSDARRRALQFTGVAAGLTASGTAAAAASATSLVKTLVLTVTLGAAGGGVMSLAISKTYSHFENSKVDVDQAPIRPARPTSTPQSQAANPASAPTAVIQNSEVPAEAEAAEAQPPVSATPLTSASARAVSRSSHDTLAPPSTSTAEFDKDTPRTSLYEEQRSIELVRAAVARGDTATALSLLDAYERRYQQKQFGPEALALRVQALSARGERARAAALATEFARKYPHHPLLSRVQSSTTR